MRRYVEDAVRWSSFATYAVRDPSVLGSQKRWAGKVVVIGDLMQDALSPRDQYQTRLPASELDSAKTESEGSTRADDKSSFLTIGVLFGSKGVKLRLGVPYFAATVKAIAAILENQPDAPRKRVRFIAPLAPTVSVEDVRTVATRELNEFAGRFGCDTVVTSSGRSSIRFRALDALAVSSF